MTPRAEAVVRHGAYPRRMGEQRAFSLVELVVVVTILGLLAAMAVPRLTSAATDADGQALRATLTNVRKAIDVYYAEHGSYPGYDPATGLPDDDAFVDQLLLYTDAGGNTNATYGHLCIYGPYLRSPFPKNPTNGLRTVGVKAQPGSPDPPAGSVGWIAVLSHGYFGIHATDEDLVGLGMVDSDQKGFARGPAGLSH